jgi:N-acetylglucosaminyldiphosphoundecaprenol N-acetyl-beta-D-mannosaminyltransferase
MARIILLGIPIDAVTQQEALRLLHSYVSTGLQHHVMTPNSEMLVEAVKNPGFKQILRTSALNLPDSAGLLFAARWTHQYLPERVTGVDTVQLLCQMLDGNHPIFLLGAAPGIAEKAAKILLQKNPQLVVAGTYSGSPNPKEAPDIIQRISATSPHILFVAFGSPMQDMWISEHLHKLPSVRVAMGVGGTFDYIAHVQKRAPVFLQSLHLEWLYRLLREPKRIKRIWRAVVVFPFLVLRDYKRS